MRLLPVLAAQMASVAPSEGPDRAREGVIGVLRDFPATKLIVYPEYYTCRVEGDPTEREARFRECAEPIDGPRVQALCEVARQNSIWLIPGTVIESTPDGGLYNTAIAISPAGEVVASYRKIFPWRPFEPFDPGSSLVTFDIADVGRVGLAICYDLWFPELIRQLAWLGAELVVLPTQTSTSDRAQELVLARAAAIANQVWVLSINGAAPVGTGQSLLVDPEGVVRTSAPSETEALLTHVIDMDDVTRVRQFGTCGLNRMWSQHRPGDPGLDLPLYGGRIDPGTWASSSLRPETS